MANRYLLISLPTSICPSGGHDEALTALRSTITTDVGTVVPFKLPELKIGTLDALVQQADDLAKLENGCEAVVGKVGASLKSILEGDQSKLERQKTVNEKPVGQYLASFSWNKVKYRVDRPIGELVSMLQKEIVNIDNDVRNAYTKYSLSKNTLTTLQKKQSGNLSNKSLTSIVPAQLIVQSEHLETHLVAVPSQQVRDFSKKYETISPWIVPRSAQKIEADDEFALFSVVVFKKHGPDFLHKCREQRWVPREYQPKEGGREEERRELGQAEKEERKLWGEALRFGRIGWSDSVMAMLHVLALRVFVETVLRYGLPLDFACGLVKTTPKLIKRARNNLDGQYSYLGGNALGRDKKGRVIKDDSIVAADMQTVGQGDGVEYSAYVCYEFEIQ